MNFGDEPMDRRRNSRVKVHLPVQVWGLDAHGQAFTDPAVVTNLSAAGLVLQGLRRKIRVGETLDVRLGNDRAQYRVMWIRGVGHRACELGMQRVTAPALFPNSVFPFCAQATGTC